MKKLIIFLLVLMGTGLMAQQDALYNQYMFNMLVLNPGYAGTTEAMNLTFVDRQQWIGLDGAPHTSSFSIHSPLRNDKIGLGLYAYSDVLGPVKGTGALATYSYKIRIGEGKLSFGLQFGIKTEYIDWNKLDMPEYDGSLSEIYKQNINLDANIGIYFYTDNYYVGVSSKQLLEKNIGGANFNGQNAYAKLLRHFYGMAGIAIPLNDNIVFKPAILVKYVKNAPVQFDFNASFLINDVLWLGTSYRTKRTFVLMTEILISKGVRLGYSYDMFLNTLNVTNSGSHEIMLGLDLPVYNKRMKTVRYF